MNHQELIPHLFRTEYRKIVSVLSKRFGFGQVEIAEDIASDTFLSAAQTWGIRGMPENPVAWLYQVAKNKSINYLQRARLFDNKIEPLLKRTQIAEEFPEIDLSPENIQDSQLQMMFAICHPSISPEAQIGLSLRILCGFGIDEIADAFLTNKETINKRLYRAREILRSEDIKIELPDASRMDSRLETVLRTIYLLFNEGYHSQSRDTVLRQELCTEAMRLCNMLIENPSTNKPSVNAFMALMCFHASRFDARTDQHGEIVLYDDQDENLWNQALISRGGYFMNQSAQGHQVTKFHLEAALAYWTTQKTDNSEKWTNILLLYDQLRAMEYSPMAELNRIYAISRVNGCPAAIVEAEKLKLKDNPFYFTLLGELYAHTDQKAAEHHFSVALSLAKTESARKLISKKLNRLGA